MRKKFWQTKKLKRVDIGDFAKKHRLKLVVEERRFEAAFPFERWCARFDGSETKENRCSGILCGTYSTGSTEWEAVAKYAREISHKVLVLDTYGKNRREIDVPLLTLRDE